MHNMYIYIYSIYLEYIEIYLNKSYKNDLNVYLKGKINFACSEKNSS